MTSIRNERGGSLQTIKGQQAQWQNLPAISGDVRDAGSIPGLGRSPGEGNDNLLWNSFLGNPMDRGAWGVKVHVVTKSGTQLSN